MMILLKISFTLTLILLNANAFGEPNSTLNLTGEEFYNVGPSIHYYHDKEGTLKDWHLWEMDKEKKIPWLKNTQKDINFGYQKIPHWLKVDIVNQNLSNQEWVLELASPLLDNISIYLINHSGETTVFYHAGDQASTKVIDHPNFLFPINLPVNEKHTLYIHIESKGSIQVPIKIWTWNAFNERTTVYFTLQGIFIGLILFTLIFHSALLISKREKIYLFYSGYIFFVCAFHLGRQGMTFQFLWPSYSYLNDSINVMTLLLSSSFICYFINELFELKKQHSLISRLTINYGYFYLLMIPLYLIISYNTVLHIITIMSAGLSIMVAFISVTMLKDKHPNSRYFAIAWFSFLVGATLLPFSKMGWIPRSFVTEYGMQFGIAIEIVCFSLALANRMTTMNANMISAKNQSLALKIGISQQKEKNFELQKQYLHQSIEQNRILEEKVNQRTQELNGALQKLSEANNRLRKASITDGLTGLYNRNYFDERWQSEYKRAHRDQSCLSLILLDIDHFKNINDQYGHPAGDHCLREVTKLIKEKAYRDMDLVARFGGEEFAIILPNTSTAGAKKIADAVRSNIQQLNIIWEDKTINITMSAGLISQIPKESDYLSREAMLKRADQALYEAKRNGRNRVEVYSSS